MWYLAAKLAQQNDQGADFALIVSSLITALASIFVVVYSGRKTRRKAEEKADEVKDEIKDFLHTGNGHTPGEALARLERDVDYVIAKVHHVHNRIEDHIEETRPLTDRFLEQNPDLRTP